LSVDPNRLIDVNEALSEIGEIDSDWVRLLVYNSRKREDLLFKQDFITSLIVNLEKVLNLSLTDEEKAEIVNRFQKMRRESRADFLVDLGRVGRIKGKQEHQIEKPLQAIEKAQKEGTIVETLFDKDWIRSLPSV
ncbi:hypothetical protein IID22_05280, partial [Patescibacteria group bacterium]|nr:hypothetical protein [Patescibacteria group bacterium]